MTSEELKQQLQGKSNGELATLRVSPSIDSEARVLVGELLAERGIQAPELMKMAGIDVPDLPSDIDPKEARTHWKGRVLELDQWEDWLQAGTICAAYLNDAHRAATFYQRAFNRSNKDRAVLTAARFLFEAVDNWQMVRQIVNTQLENAETDEETKALEERLRQIDAMLSD